MAPNAVDDRRAPATASATEDWQLVRFPDKANAGMSSSPHAVDDRRAPATVSAAEDSRAIEPWQQLRRWHDKADAAMSCSLHAVDDRRRGLLDDSPAAR